MTTVTLVIVLFIGSIISWITYIDFKKHYNNHEEIWNGRFCFADTREVKETDVFYAFVVAALISIVFIVLGASLIGQKA
ncbi:MAG: hypothetical protein K9W44_01455 [Candidatus Lokiarchaeota archaeon]|nr:hypothetical protein [Candidatus Harpocratesius repetitus]